MVSIGRVAFWGAVILIGGIVLFPFYWMVISSTKGFGELFAIPPVFWPSEISWAPYREVWSEHRFSTYFFNSLIVASLATLLTLLMSVPASYAIARLRFSGKNIISQSFLAVYTFPPILLLIPLFSLFSFVGLRDSLYGLIIIYMAQTIPVSLYMLANYFRSIPREIEEAGMVDGCGRFQVIIRVTLPLSTPILLAVGTYVFMIAWNEFLFAYVLLDSPEKFTMSKGLYHLFSSYHTAWDKVMAASVLMTLPVIVLFLLFERHLIQGLIAGGVKG